MNEQKDLEEKSVLVSHIEQVPFSHSEKACERAIGFSEDDVVLMSARKQVENAGTLAYMYVCFISFFSYMYIED